MKNLLQKGGTVFTYISGGLTLITFAQGIKSNNQNKDIINSLNDRVNKQEEIIEKYSSILEQNKNNTVIKSKIAAINETTENSINEQDNINKILEKMNEQNITQDSLNSYKTDLAHHIKNQTKNLDLGNKNFEELRELVENLLGSNTSNNLLDLNRWNDYLNSLPNEKIGAIGHILLS